MSQLSSTDGLWRQASPPANPEPQPRHRQSGSDLPPQHWNWARTRSRIHIMLRFTKMNGAGNDFVMIDNRAGDVRLRPEEIVRICDRHCGVGADGILLLEKGSNGADFRMRYYNRDGGEAEMCWNGARCFVRFASKIAHAPEKISFQTPAGLIRGELDGESVTLQMSEPKDLRLDIEVIANGAKERVHFINSGVPHV